MNLRRMTAYLTSIVLVLTSCGCIHLESYTRWNYPGPIQVIEHDNKLLMFIQIDIRVSGGITAYDAPKNWAVGNFQDLLIFGNNGLVSKNRLETDNDKCCPSIHPMISEFILKDNMVLLHKGRSRNYRASAFILKHNAFVLLTNEQYKSILGDGSNIPSYKDILEQSKKCTIYTNYIYYDASFIWNDSLIKFTNMEQDDLSFWVTITNDKLGWKPIILKYDKDIQQINHTQYKEIPRMNPGHAE